MATRHWRLAGLILLAAVFGTGCNLIALPYFLLTGATGAKTDPKWPLTPKEKGKEVKVVILGWSALDVRPEFVRADRDISESLAQQLKRGFKDNDEKVTIVPVSQVEAYKDRHPDWKSMNLEDVGAAFNADYVIYLELHSLSLYEQGSGNMLYHGRTDVSITLVDVHDPTLRSGDSPSYEYPVSKGPIAADDMTPRKFRQDFLAYIAKRLSWNFTAHPIDDDIQCE
jgi:hypothetical protein